MLIEGSRRVSAAINDILMRRMKEEDKEMIPQCVHTLTVCEKTVKARE